MPVPEPISVEDLHDIHDQVINSPDGAASGVRDAGALEAAVARPQSSFGGVEFYPTTFDKAAAIMESIIQRHPFVDGNKRTGLLAAVFLLYQEGYTLGASQREQADLAVNVADHVLDVDGLSGWFAEHTRR